MPRKPGFIDIKQAAQKYCSDDAAFAFWRSSLAELCGKRIAPFDKDRTRGPYYFEPKVLDDWMQREGRSAIDRLVDERRGASQKTAVVPANSPVFVTLRNLLEEHMTAVELLQEVNYKIMDEVERLERR